MREVSDPYLLKMDCEGCEVDVIINDYDHVRAFKKLIIEHHAKFTGISYTLLLDKLAKDFQCVVTPGVPWAPKEDIGLLWRDRVG